MTDINNSNTPLKRLRSMIQAGDYEYVDQVFEDELLGMELMMAFADDELSAEDFVKECLEDRECDHEPINLDDFHDYVNDWE